LAAHENENGAGNARLRRGREAGLPTFNETGRGNLPHTEDKGFYLDLLRAYFDSANDAIFVLCDEMKFLFCNRVAEAWLGEPEADLTRHLCRIPIDEFLRDPESKASFRAGFAKALAGQPARFECRLDPPRGESHRVELSLNRVGVEGGQMVVGVARDVTLDRQTEDAVHKLSSAIEQTADSVVITDLRGTIEYVNPAFEKTTGYSRREALGQTPRLVKSGKHDAAYYERLWQTILRGDVFRGVFVNRRKDGSLYYEEKTITPLKDEKGVITNFVATGKDVTERMEAQERLDRLAHYDALTGLPNRSLFRDRLQHALNRAQRSGRQVAVLVLDLDNFKTINDSLGHDAGDRLLQAVAGGIRVCLRAEDTAARLGGDEFVIVLEDVERVEEVSAVAHKLVDILTQPIQLGEQEVFVTASLGIALYPDDAPDLDDLLKYADTAMYRAKEQGRNTYRFYSAEMSARVREHLVLRTQLRRALERDEFELYYQPIVELATGRVVALEALARWRHPEAGLLDAGKFIPVAEESGLIVPLGEWAFRCVCRDLRAWKGSAGAPVRIAVNVSARQFADPGFLAAVGCMRCLQQNAGACAGAIELEITESVLMQHVQHVSEALKAFRENGIRLAIDDFGVGYSSLEYLKRFRVDTVKIDRTFIRDMVDNPDAAALVAAIVAMAHALRLEVVAEGVEDGRQLELLREYGCDLVQGFYLSRPVPAELVAAMLTGGLLLPAV
jgi:diguanylate cyclase (GGDEF)-like protein/PAS domain S-box-containing protein